MSYLVELVIKFPIDWHLNLKSLFFEPFSIKKMMLPLMKNAKIGPKNYFPESYVDR